MFIKGFGDWVNKPQEPDKEEPRVFIDLLGEPPDISKCETISDIWFTTYTPETKYQWSASVERVLLIFAQDLPEGIEAGRLKSLGHWIKINCNMQKLNYEMERLFRKDKR